MWGTPVQEPAVGGQQASWETLPWFLEAAPWMQGPAHCQHGVKLFQGPCKVLREPVSNKKAGRNSLYFKGDYLQQRFVGRKHSEGWSQDTCSCDPVTFQKPRQDRKDSGFQLQESCWALTHSNLINLFPKWIITSFFFFLLQSSSQIMVLILIN